MCLSHPSTTVLIFILTICTIPNAWNSAGIWQGCRGYWGEAGKVSLPFLPVTSCPEDTSQGHTAFQTLPLCQPLLHLRKWCVCFLACELAVHDHKCRSILLAVRSLCYLNKMNPLLLRFIFRISLFISYSWLCVMLVVFLVSNLSLFFPSRNNTLPFNFWSLTLPPVLYHPYFLAFLFEASLSGYFKGNNLPSS